MSGTREQLGDGGIDQLQAQPVNLTGAAIKSVGARWLVQLYENNPRLIVNGFLKAISAADYNDVLTSRAADEFRRDNDVDSLDSDSDSDTDSVDR